jgi:hypothetical protein
VAASPPTLGTQSTSRMTRLCTSSVRTAIMTHCVRQPVSPVPSKCGPASPSTRTRRTSPVVLGCVAERRQGPAVGIEHPRPVGMGPRAGPLGSRRPSCRACSTAWARGIAPRRSRTSGWVSRRPAPPHGRHETAVATSNQTARSSSPDRCRSTNEPPKVYRRFDTASQLLMGYPLDRVTSCVATPDPVVQVPGSIRREGVGP